MAINPKLNEVQIGDIFVSDIAFVDGDPVFYISTVVEMEPIDGTDRLLVVQIQNNEGRYMEYEGKKLSYSQLTKGVV